MKTQTNKSMTVGSFAKAKQINSLDIYPNLDQIFS